MSKRGKKSNSESIQNQAVIAPDLPLNKPNTNQIKQDNRELREKNDQEYEKHINTLEEMRSNVSKEYDKWLLTLSGSALGLSLTFIKDVLPHDRTWILMVFLYLAWVIFALIIMITITNIQLSYSAFQKHRQIADQKYELYVKNKLSHNELWDGIRFEQDNVKRNHYIEWFNWINLVLFIVGISFLIIFVGCNLHPTIDPKISSNSQTTNIVNRKLDISSESVSTSNISTP